MSVDIDTSLIPSPKNNLHQKVDFADGDTNDIITSILRQDKDNDSRFCKFAKQFDKDNLYDLWYFVRYQIKYKEDADGVQHIKSPAALWEMKVGDCKSKTLFINQILRCLGIDYKIRFASYTSSRKPTHVYSIAIVGNQEIILDSVYHKFNAQKAYNNKKDFGMTEISRITGIGKYPRSIGDIDVEGCIQKELEVIRQKQNVIPQDEFIEYSKITEGEAHAKLAIDYFEVKKVMDEQQSKYYATAIEYTKKLLYNNGKGFSNVCATSIPEGCEQLAKFLEYQSRNNAPAMRWDRWKDYLPTPLQKAANAKVGRINGWTSNTCFTGVNGTNFCLPNANTPNVNLTVQNDLLTNGKYAFASQSQYVKTAAQILPKIKQLVLQMLTENAIVDGQALTKTSTFGTTIQYKKLDHVSAGFTQMDYRNINQTALDTSLNSPIPPWTNLYFLSADYKLDFIHRLRTASGIFDEYYDEIMNKNQKLANGFIYGYCTDTKKQGTNQYFRLADYPPVVLAKYATHAGYISGMSQFTGISESLIKAKGNTTIAFTNGKDAQDILGGLMRTTRPNIGDPITLAIIGLIAAIVAALPGLIVAFASAKNKGESMDTLPDNFKPIGAALQLSEDDWTGTGTGSGTGTGTDGNTPPKSSKLPLILGAAAAYYFYNKK